MEAAINIAAYIADRYKNETGVSIDEMKLHKLLYFSQRECVIQTGSPLFSEQFYAWKYGPVLVKVRDIIRKRGIVSLPSGYELPEKYLSVMNKVFSQYAHKTSWSLSRLSHGEISWQKARNGFSPDESCGVALSLEDIKADAQRIRLRRSVISILEKR